MKTRIILMLLFLTTTVFVYNQKLSELYKKDLIQLEPENDYAQNNNWKELFYDYNSTGFGRPLGQRKKIVIAPDGSVFMSHKTLHEIWKFDSKGNLVKKFGSQGSKPGQFVYLPSVEGILDGKYLITDDVQGRLNFFDLNGNFIKVLKLDYMPEAITPLRDGKIAILGYVPWKETQSKNILRIKDCNSGSEKEIWQEFEAYNKNIMIAIKIPHGGSMSYSLPYNHPMALRFRLATSKNGNLIIASPKTGDVKEYNPDGQVLNTFKLNIVPLKITDEDINEQYDRAVKNEVQFEDFLATRGSKLTDSEKKEMIDSYKKQMINYKDRKFYPENLPYFSSLIIDSDGNLLVFEYTKDEDKTSNKFRAYSYDMKGNFLGTSSFKSESFDLSFTASTFQFHNSFVYAVINKNADKNSPPQIVKMKLQ
jgi:6-bladed beta-propeller